MGIMTLQNFRDDLQDALTRSPDPARLDRWINNSILEVAYAFQFPELEAVGTFDTVAGQVAYNMPADFRMMHENGVRRTAPQAYVGGIIEAESRTQYLRNYTYDIIANRGIVAYYHMYQKKMWLRPRAQDVYTVEFDYWKKLTPLLNPTDLSPLEDDWDEIVFRGALYRGHLQYGEHDRVLNVFNLFLSDIRSRVMAADLQEFPEGGISMIQASFENQRR
jgi:hypothetical protein